jgi:photosystem II stability/assembly factor-like uncharacterized protein
MERIPRSLLVAVSLSFMAMGAAALGFGQHQAAAGATDLADRVGSPVPLNCSSSGPLRARASTASPDSTTVAVASLSMAPPYVNRAAEAGAAAGTGAGDRALNEDDLAGLKWRSIGPANMGGRVAALALVPGSSKTFYVGYATGGIFKTENNGVTFKPVFDKYPVLSIGSIAVADAPESWTGWEKERAGGRVDPEKAIADQGKGRIVWVGTGEGNGRNSSSWGGGVYRSTDGGRSFEHLGLTQSHDIPRLAVDPRDPDVAYVAALGHLWGPNPERGVFKTDDGGATWSHVLKVDDDTGACDVVMDPGDPDTVYAALYTRRRTRWSFSGNSEAGGIFRSDDAGGTWKKLTEGLPPVTGRIGLAVYPKDTRVLYASVESNHGGSGRTDFDNFSPSGGVFRSEDRGDSWTRLSDLNPRPFYFSRIAVDPEDDQRVYLPGWDMGISDDGGRSFRRSGSEFVHVDFHAITIDPRDPSHILVGNDGGVYVSYDRAVTWDYLNNVAVGQFYRVSVDMSDPYRVGGGLQDNGSWIGPSETLHHTIDHSRDGILNDDWRMIHGGDGYTVAFDPTDPDLVYATSQGGHLARIRLDNAVRRILKAEAREGEERLRFNWDAPFLISKHDPTVLYHGGNRLFKLTERGDRWFDISGDLTRNEVSRTATVGSDAETYGTIVSLAESPLKQGLLWVGTDDGRVHVSENDGQDWSEVTPDAVNRMYVSRVTASGHDSKIAYVAVDGHRSDLFEPILLVTTDLGRSWTDISGDLPGGGPVRVVIEDPASPEVLYCGTEFGVYVTLDRGDGWISLNGKSLPPVAVHDMVIHPRERDLILGTHGRSIYILDDASMFGQLTGETRGKRLALLQPLPGRPRLYAGQHYGLGHGLFRAKNPPLGAYINFWVREDAGKEVEVEIADPAGLVIRELKATSRLGLNRIVWDLQADEKHRFRREEEGWYGQTQFVSEGTYKVTLTMGDEKAESTVEVLRAPNARP